MDYTSFGTDDADLWFAFYPEPVQSSKLLAATALTSPGRGGGGGAGAPAALCCCAGASSLWALTFSDMKWL